MGSDNFDDIGLDYEGFDRSEELSYEMNFDELRNLHFASLTRIRELVKVEIGIGKSPCRPGLARIFKIVSNQIKYASGITRKG